LRGIVGESCHPEWPELQESISRALIEEGVREGVATPWPAVEAQTVLGGDVMIEEVRAQIKEGHREIVGRGGWKRRRAFQELVAIVEGYRGQSWSESGIGVEIQAVEMVWWLARRPAGMTLRVLGDKAGRTDYSAVGMALKRYELKKRRTRR